MSPAVSVSNTGVNPRAVSHSLISMRCGVAAVRRPFARIPTREMGWSGIMGGAYRTLRAFATMVDVFGFQVEEELAVATRAGDGRRCHRHALESGGFGCDRHFLNHGVVNGWIGDDAAFADLVSSGLELRLDQCDDVRIVREQRSDRREDVMKRNER